MAFDRIVQFGINNVLKGSLDRLETVNYIVTPIKLLLTTIRLCVYSQNLKQKFKMYLRSHENYTAR